MKKFAFFSDILFAFFLSAIVTLFLFRYLGVALLPALLLSVLAGGLTAAGVGALLAFKRKNLYLKRSDESKRQKLLLHLALLSDEEKTEWFTRILSTEQEPAKRFGKLRIFTKTEFYFLKFALTPLSADEIPNLARLKTGKKKILLCSQIEDAALELCMRLGIEVKTGDWVYRRLKELSLLPDTYLGDVPAPPKMRRKLWFSKRNAKRFLVGGGFILLLSRLTPFYYYYLLFGILLLATSVFVRVFGYE